MTPPAPDNPRPGDGPPTTPVGDELLSAYLDGELRGAELAAVEARLASDPAAGQTLAELRALSRTIARLPRSRVGDGFAEAVAQRVAAAQAGADQAGVAQTPSEHNPDEQNSSEHNLSEQNPTGTAADEPRPAVLSMDAPRAPGERFSIGRSPRGWLWAGAAVAASLLVMALSPPAEQQSKRVAGRVAPAAGGESPGGELSISAAEPLAEAEPSAEDGTPPPARAEMLLAESLPAASGPAAVTDGYGATAADGGRVDYGDLDGYGGGGRRPAPAAIDGVPPALYVRVRLRPGAIASGFVDNLLAEQGIAIDQPAGEPPPSNADADVLLVDARASQVAACLTELTNDRFNCASVYVEPQLSEPQLSEPQLSEPQLGGAQLDEDAAGAFAAGGGGAVADVAADAFGADAFAADATAAEDAEADDGAADDGAAGGLAADGPPAGRGGGQGGGEPRGLTELRSGVDEPGRYRSNAAAWRKYNFAVDGLDWSESGRIAPLRPPAPRALPPESSPPLPAKAYRYATPVGNRLADQVRADQARADASPAGKSEPPAPREQRMAGRRAKDLPPAPPPSPLPAPTDGAARVRVLLIVEAQPPAPKIQPPAPKIQPPAPKIQPASPQSTPAASQQGGGEPPPAE